MGVSLMTKEGEFEVPTRGGGVNLDLLNLVSTLQGTVDLLEERISQLNNTVDELRGKVTSVEASRSSTNAYGLTKLTTADWLTDSTGFSLPATEKNPAISGTLAHRIASVNADLTSKINAANARLNGFKIGTWVGTPNGDIARFQESGAWMAIACNGDFNVASDLYVIGTWCEQSTVLVKLSRVVAHPIRINYLVFY